MVVGFWYVTNIWSIFSSQNMDETFFFFLNQGNRPTSDLQKQ